MGSTPLDLARTNLAQSGQISRNAMCPCGSKKKYKWYGSFLSLLVVVWALHYQVIVMYILILIHPTSSVTTKIKHHFTFFCWWLHVYRSDMYVQLAIKKLYEHNILQLSMDYWILVSKYHHLCHLLKGLWLCGFLISLNHFLLELEGAVEKVENMIIIIHFIPKDN